jgi:hypothetical protein
MSDVRVFAVPPELLNAVWGDACRWLKPAVDRSNGRTSISDTYLDIEAGHSVLWMVRQGEEPVGYYTTRVTRYPGCKAMVLDWIGGSGISSWMHETIDAMQRHAKHNGCKHIEFTGREGWGRLLKGTGWEPEYVCYKMELSDG